MKRWQKWLVRVLKLKGTLDTEEALRSVRKQSYEAGYEKGVQDGAKIQFIPAVFIDQAGQKQAQAQVSAYEPPERNTDKPKVLHNTRGQHFMAHRHDPEFQKTQHELPRIPRRLQLTRYDGPPLPDTTMAHIPTWIL